MRTLPLLLALVGSLALVGCQSDTCEYAMDGQCDDATVENAMTAACMAGTDYTDCFSSCADTCPTANDGECDDGGPDSLYSVCSIGTDCGDCGSR